MITPTEILSSGYTLILSVDDGIIGIVGPDFGSTSFSFSFKEVDTLFRERSSWKRPVHVMGRFDPSGRETTNDHGEIWGYGGCRVVGWWIRKYN